MPAIPQYTASGRVRSGDVAAAPSIAAMTRPYDALADVGQSIVGAGRTALALSELHERRQKEKDLDWVATNAANYQNALVERMHQDEMNPRETQGEEFKTFAETLANEFAGAAPTPGARKLFTASAQQDINRGYESALKKSERTRLENADASTRKAIGFISDTYRKTLAFDTPEWAARDIAPKVNLQFATIEERFGATMPSFANRLKTLVAEEIVAATASTNPDYARQMVQTAPIGEEVRATLINRIEQEEANAGAVERIRFGYEVDQRLKNAGDLGVEMPTIPPEEFKSRYGKRWDEVYTRFELARNAHNTAVKEMQKLKGMNPDAQEAAIAKIATTGDENQKAAIGTMLARLAKQRQQAEKDPVGWQLQNDPDAQSIQQIIATLPPEAQAETRKSFYQFLIDRQGHARPGDTNPERFLGLPTKRILSADQADRRKAEMLAASPDDRIKMIDALESEFGPELANIAWRDMLETGKEKIPTTLRFLSVIQDPNTRLDFSVAQSVSEDLSKVDPEKTRDYTDAIDSNQSYQSFKSAWMREQGEGVGDIAEMSSALLSYARSIVIKEKVKPKEAAELAIKRAIDANYGFADTNGRTLAVSKHRAAGGQPRTNDEITDIGRKLGVITALVPPSGVALSDPYSGRSYFPNLPPTFDASKPEHAKLLRDQITSQAFWQIEADGESATLFISAPDSRGMPLLNKSHQPITVRFDELPEFVHYMPDGGPLAIWSQAYPRPSITRGVPITGKDLKTPAKDWSDVLKKDRRNFKLE